MNLEPRHIKKVIRENQNSYSRHHFLLISEILYNFQNSLLRDMDAFLLLVFISKRALENYHSTNKDVSKDELLNLESINAGLITIDDLSKSLKLPRETARRKYNKLLNLKLISKNKKNTVLENKAIQIQQVDKFHLKFLKCLNLVITKILESPDVKIKSISLVNLNKKYSKSWLQLLTMVLNSALAWKKHIGSMQNWFIFGVCALNQIYNIKEYKNFFKNLPDNPDNLFLNLTQEQALRGLNTNTISVITGIPRQTVTRNLVELVKLKFLTKDRKKNLYFISRNTLNQKSLATHYESIHDIISKCIFECIDLI